MLCLKGMKIMALQLSVFYCVETNGKNYAGGAVQDMCYRAATTLRS